MDSAEVPPPLSLVSSSSVVTYKEMEEAFNNAIECQHKENPWYNCPTCRGTSNLTMKPDTSWREGLSGDK